MSLLRSWVRESFRHISLFSTGTTYTNVTGQADETAAALTSVADGKNMECLRAINAAHDPENFFRVNANITPATVASRGSQRFNITGRLAAGVSPEQASEALNAVARRLGEQYPAPNKGMAVDVVSLKQQLNGDAPRIVTILAGAILAVLLIACTNVASLLAVRASLACATSAAPRTGTLSPPRVIWTTDVRRARGRRLDTRCVSGHRWRRHPLARAEVVLRDRPTCFLLPGV